MNNNIKNTAGFSLIEVMITVVIVGILLAVAVPGYRDYIISSNRTAATACLTELAQFMERTYTQSMAYNPVGFVFQQSQCRDDLAERYTFTLSNHAARTFTLSAIPTTLQSDAACGTLTLNQAGQRGAAGGVNAATVRQCW